LDDDRTGDGDAGPRGLHRRARSARAEQEGQSGSGSQGGQLAVTVEYKGAGTVDKEHRLWIFVFDTPNISAE
jgi:hypothetical protein